MAEAAPGCGGREMDKKLRSSERDGQKRREKGQLQSAWKLLEKSCGLATFEAGGKELQLYPGVSRVSDSSLALGGGI